LVLDLNGVAQAGVQGSVNSELKIVSFAADQSSVFNTDSYFQMSGCPDGTFNKNDIKFPYSVIEVNRGGGANFNVVIKEIDGVPHLSPAGFVIMSAKSIFTTELVLAADATALEGDMWVGDEYTNFVGGNILDGELLGFYFKDMQFGNPENFSAILY